MPLWASPAVENPPCCIFWEAWTGPPGGKVYLEGKSVFDLKDRQLAILRRRRIGFVFQSYNLLGEHTARENISIPLNLDGRDPEPAFSGR